MSLVADHTRGNIVLQMCNENDVWHDFCGAKSWPAPSVAWRWYWQSGGDEQPQSIVAKPCCLLSLHFTSSCSQMQRAETSETHLCHRPILSDLQTWTCTHRTQTALRAPLWLITSTLGERQFIWAMCLHMRVGLWDGVPMCDRQQSTHMHMFLSNSVHRIMCVKVIWPLSGWHGNPHPKSVKMLISCRRY